jgi:membrane fusion protein (multidrug efflux system)
MRRVVPIVIIVSLVVILAGIKFAQIKGLIAAGAQAQKNGPPPEQVGSAVATQEKWEGTLASVGSVAAVKGVTISTEVAGTVSAIRFESGQQVRAGQVLVELDTSVERAQLASVKARRELAEVSLERSRKLAGSAAISKAQLDTDEAALKTASADFSALAAQIERKTLRAPFSGRLGIRQVNLGQFLAPGTPVTVLESQGAVYIDFSLPQEELARVPVGTPVRVTLGGGEKLDGKVAAVDPTVEAASRTIKLRATVPSNTARLQAGMFVQVAVVLPEQRDVIAVPATGVMHASFGDSVYVVEDKKDEGGVVQKDPSGKPLKVARQQFVRVGPAQGDFVSILDGVKAGQEIVTAGGFKLRNGAGIVVRNEVGPTPALHPNVENR